MSSSIVSDKENIRLICLPFSGGSGFAFQPLINFFPKNWNVTTLTYPGRGERISEPLVHTMEALIEDCWQQIHTQLQPPYVLFGHSLGSTLAFLLAHTIKHKNAPAPFHLVLTGTDAPIIPSKKPHRYLFSKNDFKAKLDSYGGISQEILNNDDAFDFFEPIIRADFQIGETWQYQVKPKLETPATVITGIAEDLELADIRKWQQEFESPIQFKQMNGNHFFLFDQPEAFVKIIQQEIEQSFIKKNE